MKQRTLKQARTSAGLTQEQLEELSGVSQAVISRLERNAAARPAFETVKRLAAALDIEPTRLRFGAARPEAIAS